MPIHDWARLPSGLFHDFHQTWTVQIKALLNTGILPKGLTALVEQKPKEWKQWQPDVLAVEKRRGSSLDTDGGLLILDPPSTQMVFRTDEEIYADRANRVIIKHHMGKTVAIIELVSPGNKSSRSKIEDFVEKVVEFIQNGVHVLVVDLFPPTSRDPEGIHKLIWNEIKEDSFSFPLGHNLILAAYEAGREKVAYVEPVAVGDKLPPMPLFLAVGKHVMLPLELSYQMAWATCTEEFRTIIETGVLPEEYDEDSEE